MSIDDISWGFLEAMLSLWPALLFALLHFVARLVAGSRMVRGSRPSYGGSQLRHPIDLGLLGIFLWGFLITLNSEAFFLWGSSVRDPKLLRAESLYFLAAVFFLVVIVLLDAAGLEVNRRRGDSARPTSISGLTLAMRAVVVGGVLLDWGWAMFFAAIVVPK